MIARLLALCTVAPMLSFSAWGQGSLEDLVSRANADWMFAKWQAETDNGDKVTLTVSWELDKHVVVLRVQVGDMQSNGYTVLEPNAELPRYYSFDNQGSVGKGSWNMENGDLILRVDSETPTRGPRKAAFVFSGTASTGLQVSMHNIDSSGDLATPARTTLKFKKQD